MGKYPKPTAHSSCLIFTMKQSSLLCNMSPEFTPVRCPCYKSQAHLGNPVFRERRETQGVSFSASYPNWKREWKLVRTLILGAISCSALFSWQDSLWSPWQGYPPSCHALTSPSKLSAQDLPWKPRNLKFRTHISQWRVLFWCVFVADGSVE